jgi:hypothetical protein
MTEADVYEICMMLEMADGAEEGRHMHMGGFDAV